MIALSSSPCYPVVLLPSFERAAAHLQGFRKPGNLDTRPESDIMAASVPIGHAAPVPPSGAGMWLPEVDKRRAETAARPAAPAAASPSAGSDTQPVQGLALYRIHGTILHSQPLSTGLTVPCIRPGALRHSHSYVHSASCISFLMAPL